jgi:hypothetical protein
VHRARPQRLQLVVVFGAVELERVDAARAFFGIEPAPVFRMSGSSFVVEALVAKPAGSRGGLSGLETLQDRHGIPGAPHPQAFSPSQGRSSCLSQTQKVS